MPYQVVRGFVVACCVILVSSACVHRPAQKEFIPPQFPPLPAEPRFVYDASLRNSRAVLEPTTSEKLQSILTGKNFEPIGLAKPFDVAVHQGRIYVSDTQQRAVLLFDTINKQFKIIGTEGKGMLLKPMGIVISKQLQELFVVDISAKRIAVFDLEGKYKRQIGRPADFVRPTGIAISNNGEKIYVVETGGINSDDHHVLILDSQSGKLIKKVGHRGTQDGEFNIPLSITVTPDGDFFVIDSGNFRVQRFSHNGIYKSQFGSIGRRGGQFSRPKSISSDSQGNIYVVDTAFGNFQIFTPQGQLLLHVGDRGTSGGPARFMLPAGIDVDEQGRVYMIDQFFRKLEIFLPSGIEALPLLVKH